MNNLRRVKPDWSFIGSLILVVISLIGLGYIFWNWNGYVAGR
jgi:hypothetical protein